MDEITLIVTYRCKDGKRGSFVRDVAAQGILDKILQEALQQAHLAREHMQQLKSIKERYVISTTVDKLKQY